MPSNPRNLFRWRFSTLKRGNSLFFFISVNGEVRVALPELSLIPRLWLRRYSSLLFSEGLLSLPREMCLLYWLRDWSRPTFIHNWLSGSWLLSFTAETYLAQKVLIRTKTRYSRHRDKKIRTFSLNFLLRGSQEVWFRIRSEARAAVSLEG